MQSVLETIGPKKAADYLALSNINRPLSMHHAQSLAGAMTREEWVDSASVLVFNGAGDLIDGQHRCQAVILSGKPCRFRVLRGVPAEFVYTIDTNIKKRTLADLLYIDGFRKYRTLLAGALSIVHRHDMNESMTNPVIKHTKRQQLNHLKQCPDLYGVSVPRFGSNSEPWTHFYPISSAAAFHHLFSRVDEESANRFFDILSKGISTENNAALVLRSYFVGRSHSTDYVPSRKKWALTIKSWNYYMDGDVPGKILWAAGRGEKFPTINGL